MDSQPAAHECQNAGSNPAVYECQNVKQPKDNYMHSNDGCGCHPNCKCASKCSCKCDLMKFGRCDFGAVDSTVNDDPALKSGISDCPSIVMSSKHKATGRPIREAFSGSEAKADISKPGTLNMVFFATILGAAGYAAYKAHH